MRINNLVEEIFATAVSLDQSGNMRNSIYCLRDNIYILNYDYTVLLRFKLRPSEGIFSEQVSLFANDYDSNVFQVQPDNSITFINELGNYVKKKNCRTPDLPAERVEQLFDTYIHGVTPDVATVKISNEVISLLEEDLSHVEFVSDANNNLIIIQRNIYTGNYIEIQKNEQGLFQNTNSLPYAIRPIALRTDDFKSLYVFQEVLNFSFPIDGDYVIVKGVDPHRRDMTGIVACCLYDEIIELRQSKK